MNAKPHVFDVTEADFQTRVMDRSRTVPVLVDFWAPWCGPCKALTPILEKLAAEYGGRFELAKCNIDENQQIAAAFGIQSIPLVYAFKNGQPLDGFQGAQQEKAVRQFLDRIVPAPQKSALELAHAALAANNLPAAQRAYERALAEKPDSGEALLGLARVALARRDPTGAASWLDRIASDDPVAIQAARLRGVMAFSADAGDEAELQAAVADNPKAVEAWYRLGATLAARNEFEAAFEAFLQVVGLDRGFREDAGRKAMLSLFDLLGVDDPRVVRYRKRLSALLF